MCVSIIVKKRVIWILLITVMFSSSCYRFNCKPFNYSDAYLKKGQCKVIYIRYDTGRNTPFQNTQVLDSLAEFLKSRPKINIKVEVHTSCSGDDEFNLRLSKERAENIKAYLYSKNISKQRLDTKCYGGRYPVYDCKQLKQEKYSQDSIHLLNERICIVLRKVR